MFPSPLRRSSTAKIVAMILAVCVVAVVCAACNPKGVATVQRLSLVIVPVPEGAEIRLPGTFLPESFDLYITQDANSSYPQAVQLHLEGAAFSFTEAGDLHVMVGKANGLHPGSASAKVCATDNPVIAAFPNSYLGSYECSPETEFTIPPAGGTPTEPSAPPVVTNLQLVFGLAEVGGQISVLVERPVLAFNPALRIYLRDLYDDPQTEKTESQPVCATFSDEKSCSTDYFKPTFDISNLATHATAKYRVRKDNTNFYLEFVDDQGSVIGLSPGIWILQGSWTDPSTKKEYKIPEPGTKGTGVIVVAPPSIIPT